MKFLCVPCDSPMKLRAVNPPERGSLSVVYECPECGYEMAMLTNAYETQMVQSLGVRIGPDRAGAEGAPASQAEASAETGASGAKCPFSAMIPGPEQLVQPVQPGEPVRVRWTPGAEARLANIPEFVRPMAKTGIEKYALDRGAVEVDEDILNAAREFFGM